MKFTLRYNIIVDVDVEVPGEGTDLERVNMRLIHALKQTLDVDSLSIKNRAVDGDWPRGHELLDVRERDVDLDSVWDEEHDDLGFYFGPDPFQEDFE